MIHLKTHQTQLRCNKIKKPLNYLNLIMTFKIDDVIKIIILINAKLNGWTVLYEDIKTFYLVRNKTCDFDFSNEMNKLCKKPLNLEKVFNEIKK